MSYTVDANLLLFASDDSGPFHDHASAFLGRMAHGYEIVYLFWPVFMAYLRIATHPSIFDSPLTPEEAMGNVERLLMRPHVQNPSEQDRFWLSYRRTADAASVRGNLVPDAHLVALMHENGVRTIWTHDRDFRRFDDVDVRDPFE